MREILQDDIEINKKMCKMMIMLKLKISSCKRFINKNPYFKEYL